jgi:hypothetical protein
MQMDASKGSSEQWRIVPDATGAVVVVFSDDSGVEFHKVVAWRIAPEAALDDALLDTEAIPVTVERLTGLVWCLEEVIGHTRRWWRFPGDSFVFFDDFDEACAHGWAEVRREHEQAAWEREQAIARARGAS